jgi:hypothetical protein
VEADLGAFAHFVGICPADVASETPRPDVSYGRAVGPPKVLAAARRRPWRDRTAQESTLQGVAELGLGAWAVLGEHLLTTPGVHCSLDIVACKLR